MITLLTVCITLFLVLAAYALSWIITCGIVKLITICLGVTFTWALATGIWLMMVLIRAVFVNIEKVAKK